MVMLNLLHLNEGKIKSFIDLGAGDGILSHLILEQLSGAFGYVLDFSAPMLAEAKKRLVEYKDSVELIHGDLSAPDWQKSIFADPLVFANTIFLRDIQFSNCVCQLRYSAVHISSVNFRLFHCV